MASEDPQPTRFKVYVRWRPLSSSESGLPEIERAVVEESEGPAAAMSMTLKSPLDAATRNRSWKSGPSSFTNIFGVGAGNHHVFDNVVAPTLPLVLQGRTCNFFAYGHSGSGKTHTIIGYEYERDESLGLFLRAARELMVALDALNEKEEEGVAKGVVQHGQLEDQTVQNARFGIGLRLYELRRKSAFDLLNGHNECYVREGPDGQTHIRGETEMLENGKVRVRPLETRACWTFDQVRRHLSEGLQLRATGSSTVHDESSRTHAVLELEIVNSALLKARDAVVERQSELVPVGKRATDVYLEEMSRSLIKDEAGKYHQNPDCRPDQARIDAAEAEKREFEDRLAEAEADVSRVSTSSPHPCLGGKFVFVDLAGSEYFDQGKGTSTLGTSPSPQERQEGRQINTDLFGLKEVLRARASGQARIPFRSSPLTMALREHFVGSADSSSAMILTVSPSSGQFSATTNTLKYGDLVGMASTGGAVNAKASTRSQKRG